MKYLDKFARYLSESNEISIEDVKEFIIPFQDMGLECNISAVEILTSGKFMGRKSRKIIIDISKLEKDVYGSILDQNIWEILDELITLKNRLESDEAYLSIGSSFIIITFLEKGEVNSDLAELIKLYRSITSKHTERKTDFTKSILSYIDLDEEKITIKINSREYTDRKWNLLIRDIDFSKFDIDKHRYDSVIILTIVPKKKL